MNHVYGCAACKSELEFKTRSLSLRQKRQVAEEIGWYRSRAAGWFCPAHAAQAPEEDPAGN